MSESRAIAVVEPSSTGMPASPCGAKASLLAWAEDCDVRTARARSRVGKLAAAGAIAVLGGLVIARTLTPRSRSMVSIPRARGAVAPLLTWALAARVGQFLLPLAVRALHARAQRRAVNRTTGADRAIAAHAAAAHEELRT